MRLPRIEVFIIADHVHSEVILQLMKKAAAQVDADVFCGLRNLLCGIYVTFSIVQANYCYLFPVDRTVFYEAIMDH